MVLVSGTPERIERVAGEAATLEGATGMGVLTRPTVGPEAQRQAPGQRYRVSASALDHEGIVRAVSTALYRTGSNILSLETTAYNAPETGSPLFRMDAVIELPEGVSAEQVRRTLDPVARQENLDIDLTPR
jgi:glycine cleavage system transcriptional repressor